MKLLLEQSFSIYSTETSCIVLSHNVAYSTNIVTLVYKQWFMVADIVQIHLAIVY